MKKKSVIILQLNENIEDTRYLCYSSLEFIKKAGLEIKRCFYLPVYSTQVDVESDDTNQLLEELFANLQFEKPEGYTGRSLSVSDIIEVDGVPFYVDDFGFKQIQL